LIQRKVTVIAATTTPAAQAAKAATSTVPIVFTTGGDPIKLGLVASLNRPGGNVTGVSNLIVELGSKQLGLLRELVPATTAIGTLMRRSVAGTARPSGDVEGTAGSLASQLLVLRAGRGRHCRTGGRRRAERWSGGGGGGADPFLLNRWDPIGGIGARDAFTA